MRLFAILFGIAIGAFGIAAVFLYSPAALATLFGPSWSIFGSPPQAEITPQTPIKQMREQGLLLLARSAVAARLNDPYSAVFAGLHVLKDEKGSESVCGFVNAKNGFGAYVGAKPFVYKRLLDMAFIMDIAGDKADNFENTQVLMCPKHL